MQIATSDDRRSNDPAFQGYLILRTGFVIAPILFGIDKFFNWMVDWPTYLAPWLNRLLPGTAQGFMGALTLNRLATAFGPRPWCQRFAGKRHDMRREP